MIRFLSFLFFLCFFSVCSAKELKIFLLTGQSNSLGAVKGSPASPALLKKYEPKETLNWHENFGQREGVFPGASTSWEQVRPAMPRYNGNLCMGPEYGFAFTLEKNGWFKDADVAVVKASRAFVFAGGKQCRNFRSGERFPLSGISGQSGGRSETVRGYICTGRAESRPWRKCQLGRKE